MRRGDLLTALVDQLQREVSHHPQKAGPMGIGLGIDGGDEVKHQGEGLKSGFVDAADAIVDEIGREQHSQAKDLHIVIAFLVQGSQTLSVHHQNCPPAH